MLNSFVVTELQQLCVRALLHCFCISCVLILQQLNEISLEFHIANFIL